MNVSRCCAALLLVLLSACVGGDTTPPTVSLSASTLTVTDYTPLVLTATASDNQGVARVEFYDGSSKIGQDGTPANGFTLSVQLTSKDNGSKNYTAKAFDVAGNSAVSTPVTVTVNIPKDTTPPTVSLTASANPVTMVGDITLMASASDNVGIAKVEFYRGSSKLGEDTSTPYTLTTRITRADNGTQSYKAVAYDLEGNTAESSLNLTVNIPPDTTPPTVSLSASKTSLTVPESVTFTATASDDEAVSKVELYQGTQLVQSKTAAPYTFTLNFSKANNGTQGYSAKAYDPSGNVGTSNTVTLSINILSDWPQQFGTDSEDIIYGVATDTAGNLLVAGSTGGSLGGSNVGKLDAFVRKYDTKGQVLWTRQIGTLEDDIAYGVATDASSNVLVAGSTRGALQGSNAGGADYWVRKYDASGNLTWTQQNGSSGDDVARGVAVDSSGAVAVVGSTTGNLFSPNSGQSDLFVAKYAAAGGSPLWGVRDGTVDIEQANGTAFDGNGNLYVAALWEGGAGGRGRGSLLRYSSGTGAQIWQRFFQGSVSSGIQSNTAWDVAVDSSGNPVVVGYTNGLLPGITTPAGGVIQKYTSDGTLSLTRQVGSSSTQLYSLALDSANNILVAGQLQTDTALLAKLGSSGGPLWSKSIVGLSDTTSANGVATDGSNNVFMGGTAKGGILSGTVSSKLLAFATSFTADGDAR